MNMLRYLHFRNQSKNLPQIEVDREEFIRLMIEAGWAKDAAESQATFSEGLGGHARIGDKMVGIKNDNPG